MFTLIINKIISQICVIRGLSNYLSLWKPRLIAYIKETFLNPTLIQTHLKKLFELFVRLKSLQSRLTNALFTQSERTVRTVFC